MMGGAGADRLFVYGSLQPGGPNEHVLASIGGDWQPAVIRGRLVESGWGASMGYPGLVADAAGDEVPGYLLTSTNLAMHWKRLDAFEGEEYARVISTVTLDDGAQAGCHVYVLRSSTGTT